MHQDGTSNVGLQISVTPYLSFGGWNEEQNESHLSFCNGHLEFIFFTTVGILREVGALVDSLPAFSEDVGI